MADTQFKTNINTFCSRVHMMLRQRVHKEKRSVEISAPFDFKPEPISLPGVSDEEIALLREKAAASRIGIAEMMPLSPTYPFARRHSRHERPISYNTGLPVYSAASYTVW